MPSVHSAVFDLLISNEENIPCVRQRVVSTLPLKERGTTPPRLVPEFVPGQMSHSLARARARESA